jgi:uncharacterized damage-inducible protein DinB
MRTSIDHIAAEYRRYKALAEAALAQLSDEALVSSERPQDNSIAVICWHVAGNLQSRFTDFLTDDGEKPWRQREEEFAARHVSRDELLAKWNAGFATLFSTLDALTDADLTRTVHIRQQPLSVLEALLRSLAHVSMHVGQIVYIAKHVQGPQWEYLSIAPGQSAAYNAAPTREKPPAASR